MPTPHKPRSPHHYHFLLAAGIGEPMIARAYRIAERWGAEIHHVVVDLAWMSGESYTAALAASLGLPVLDPVAPGPPPPTLDGYVLVSAIERPPDEIASIAADSARRGIALALTSRAPASRAALEPPSTTLIRATRSLATLYPHLSASTGATLKQKISLIMLIGLIIGGAVIEPEATLDAVLAVLTLPFVFVIGLRTLALAQLLLRPLGRNSKTACPRRPAAELPIYTLIVPLYREAAMIPDLLAALTRLDYPEHKLDILIAIEAEDRATAAALARVALPAAFRIVQVPPGVPRTKPRALAMALQHARGSIVAVYDAEDHPDPEQLRRALDVLARQGETVGCVQARLDIDNPRSSWLTRQFAIEYAALFDAILPLIARLGLPVPLGGTSNHFPRRLLERIGGWDPYNVTEDADLGVRLARFGWRVAVIESTTWEEAPRRWGAWLRQRTRWLKGWMQTVLVHMREPVDLMRELGELRFLGFQALMGGLVLAALVHPWFYLLLAWDIWSGRILELPESLLGQSFWGLATINLVAGYLVSMLLGLVAALRRGRWALGFAVVLLPLYWLAISYAAHRALYQLLTDPFRWEKTPHNPRSNPRARRTRAGAADRR